MSSEEKPSVKRVMNDITMFKMLVCGTWVLEKSGSVDMVMHDSGWYYYSVVNAVAMHHHGRDGSEDYYPSKPLWFFAIQWVARFNTWKARNNRQNAMSLKDVLNSHIKRTVQESPLYTHSTKRR
jgi:hypothetical protein